MPRQLRIGLYVVAGFAIWELLVSFEVIPQLLLPAPSSIVLAAYNDGLTFLDAFSVTLTEIVLSALIAAVFGLTIGLLGSATSASSLIVGGICRLSSQCRSLFFIP